MRFRRLGNRPEGAGLRSSTAIVMLCTAMAVCEGGSAGTTASTPTASRTPDAAKVLAEAGLSLPAGSTDVVVRAVPKAPFTDRYLVTLSAPADAVTAVCVAAGLGGAVLTNPPLTQEDSSLLGMQSAPAGSKGCAGSNPTDLTRQRTVLFSGDPARVWIGVWRMPAR